MESPDSVSEKGSPERRLSVPMLLLGLVFIGLWLTGAFLLGALKFMASLMANDAGVASGESHMQMVVGVMMGQAATAVAGIPAGLAFFWRSARRKLLWAFALLLAGGILVQVLSVRSFVP